MSDVGSTAHIGGRFNIGSNVDPQQFPPFPALYIADTLETAYREKFSLGSTTRRGVLDAANLSLSVGATTVVIEGCVNSVFDLTKEESTRGVCERHQEIRGTAAGTRSCKRRWDQVNETGENECDAEEDPS